MMRKQGRSNQRQLHNKKYAIMLFLVITLLALGLWGIYSFVTDAEADVPIKFTEEIWNSKKNERYRMLDSLHEQITIRGMTRTEILDFLGPDDWREIHTAYWTGAAEVKIPIHDYGGAFFHVLYIVFYFDENDICISITTREERD